MEFQFLPNLVSLLNIGELKEQIQQLSINYLVLHLMRNFSIALISTFLVLYFLELITFAQLGILISIRFLIQALLDYPTGSLGDTIGQKNVLLIALTGHIVSMYIFIIANSFSYLLGGIILQAISNSQESGALIAWYDKNYQALIENEDSTDYGEFMGKVHSINYAIVGASIVIGGTISTFQNRIFLLKIDLVLLVLNAVLIYFLVFDVSETIEEEERPSYWHKLKQGLRFVRDEKGVLFYFIGVGIYFGAGSGLWYELLLFPYYKSYGGTDFLTGLLRSIIFGIGVFLNFVAVRYSRNLTNIKRNLWIHYFVAGTLWFGMILGFTVLVPPPHSFELIPYVEVILLFVFPSISITLYVILDRRLMLEVVPNEIRNSLYSIAPSLSTIFGVVFSFVGGLIVEFYGLISGLAILVGLYAVAIVFIGIGLVVME